jgi:hypothetical protein
MQKLSTNLSLAIIDTDITIMEQLFPSLSQVYYWNTQTLQLSTINI